MTAWQEATIQHIAKFFRKHSLLFKKEKRNLLIDAMIKSAELYAIIDEMAKREEYSFQDVELTTNLNKRASWLFVQMLIDYRINYKEYLKIQDDINRFITIEPTGKVTIDPIVYNIPKHYKDIGIYPDIANGLWIKEREHESRERN